MLRGLREVSLVEKDLGAVVRCVRPREHVTRAQRGFLGAKVVLGRLVPRPFVVGPDAHVVQDGCLPLQETELLEDRQGSVEILPRWAAAIALRRSADVIRIAERALVARGHSALCGTLGPGRALVDLALPVEQDRALQFERDAFGRLDAGCRITIAAQRERVVIAPPPLADDRPLAHEAR